VRTRIGVLLCCAPLLVMLLSATAVADPSYFGYTGLLRVPTAEALSARAFNAGIFHIERRELDKPEIYAGNLGVAEGVEVGLAVIRREAGTDDIFINGKYALRPAREGRPAFAAGVIDLASEVDATVYLTMSQAFGRAYETPFGILSQGEFHVGFGGGQLDGIFGGLAANVAPTLKLMLEYDTEDFNVGARFRVARQFKIDVGLFDWSDLGLGLSYNYPY
jgi:hypothetical protein